MTSETRSRAEGLICRRCGGALVRRADPDQLVCRYCDAGYLEREAGQVAAFAPVGRIGRRRAAGVLSKALAQVGVRGHVVHEAVLVHLPFWQVEGKLVGWQCYQKPEPGDRLRAALLEVGEEPFPRMEARAVEEILSRNVVASLPACDVRGYGLLGLAHQVERLQLRPFSLETLPAGQVACAVLHSAAYALRATRLLYSSRLLPTRASRVRQRISLVRTRMRLVYYPVFRLRYTSAGHEFEASVDAVRQRVLQGSHPVRRSDRSGGWLGAGGVSGFLAGVHPVLGSLAAAGWLLARARAAGIRGRRRELAGWLSQELSGARPGVGEFRS